MLSRNRFWLYLLMCALPSSAALASDWNHVRMLPYGTAVYLDKSSIQKDHDVIIKGWVRFDYPEARTVNGMSLFRHASHRLVNCENNRYWITEWWGYPVGTQDPVALSIDAQGWQQGVPGSEAEIAVQILCSENKSLFTRMLDKAKDALPF